MVLLPKTKILDKKGINYDNSVPVKEWNTFVDNHSIETR